MWRYLLLGRHCLSASRRLAFEFFATITPNINYCIVGNLVVINLLLIWWFGNLEGNHQMKFHWYLTPRSNGFCISTSRKIPVYSPENAMSGIPLSPEWKFMSLMRVRGALRGANCSPMYSKAVSRQSTMCTRQRRGWRWEGMALKTTCPRLLNTSLCF